jgi:hypothetical protein
MTAAKLKFPDIADAPEDLDADDLADAKDEPMSAAAPTAEDVQAEYEKATKKKALWRGRDSKPFLAWKEANGYGS